MGDLLVKSRVITSDQLDEGLSYQDEEGVRLGEGLIRLGFLTERELEELLQRQGRKSRVGEQLVLEGLISSAQLAEALAEQKRSGAKLGQTLERLNVLAEKPFLLFLAQQLGVPFVDLGQFPLDRALVQQLPEATARRYRAIVLSSHPNDLLIGMADPADLPAYDQLVKSLRTPLRTALVSERSLLRLFDLSYRRSDEMSLHVARLEEEVGEYRAENPREQEGEELADAPVVRLIESLFEDAVRLNASDIHIEPDAKVLRIRQRVDGLLLEQVIKERRIAPALVSKLKLMAGIEIAEKRLPQDGRFQMSVKGRQVDVRLSTLPIQDGESVVLRLLDQSGDHLNLALVGMEAEVLARFRQQISRPNGLILVTGPTGSGKTTTLYGALNALNVPQTKIITVEEPVEYRLPRINQVQVHSKIGLTYATILRTVLRQDPDVVLVGEMRDQETSQMAVRAALTGHLVFSSLHTISAVSTTIRLIEMGLEGYAVAASLRCVLAQRLVRRVCLHCAHARPATPEEVRLIRRYLTQVEEPLQFKEGVGCSHCNQTGFHGRIAVVELLEMNRALADALRREDLSLFVRVAQKRQGFTPLPVSALSYAVRGIISLMDALRLVADAEEEPLVLPSHGEGHPLSNNHG
ncbi:MAG: Flp pilus assembly complex ATPase component TadA [Magnetococcales bacterium]|nr:Flp pilus assembly complex ATPase component TadA [Magnetococcales bacterium]